MKIRQNGLVGQVLLGKGCSKTDGAQLMIADLETDARIAQQIRVEFALRTPWEWILCTRLARWRRHKGEADDRDLSGRGALPIFTPLLTRSGNVLSLDPMLGIFEKASARDSN